LAAAPTSPKANEPPRLALAALHPGLGPAAETESAVELPPNAVAAAAASGAAACPAEMVLVEGEYCTEVRQICDDWMETPRADGVGRCRHFAPSTCIGTRVHKRFCIDKDEYTEPGETLPKSDVGWLTSKETCEKNGKRLCAESEWNFACEGEEMLPYATGYSRDATKCNYDQKQLLDHFGKPLDLRKSVAETEQCTSPFGVRNMNGNVDEWTFRDVTNGQWRSAMKGGWWMAARNRCRPATTAHDEHFHGFQAGFRCCAETK
jgi:formylglycine-generating enzyme required for sulfatase activity